jgi:hypothetical protein
MMTNARVSPTTIRVFTPASATPRQSAPMMFSDWNLLWSSDIALPRVHAAFIKLEMLIRSEEKTILRYWVPRITMKARWRSPAESQSAMCRCQYPVKSTDLPRSNSEAGSDTHQCSANDDGFREGLYLSCDLPTLCHVVHRHGASPPHSVRHCIT